MKKASFKIFFVICYWLLVIGYPAFASSPEVTKVEVMRDRGFDYLDIYTSGPVKAKGLLLEDQLQIDFPDAIISKSIEISPRHSKRVRKIRVEQVDESNARVIVELEKEIDYDIVNVFGRNKSVIEISDRVSLADRIMASWEKENLETGRHEIKPQKYAPAVAAEGKEFPLQGKVIVLDPGHGGRDPGAFSANGVAEKHLTLATAKKIAPLLKSAGATVYLTRKGDERNNLKDIVEFANKIRADILISLHYNFIGKRSISGTETYYYNPNSRYLALTMHRTLINGIKRKDRGLRKAKYYIVHHSEMPAVLLEPLYISNRDESKLAASSKFQLELAQDIVTGVINYFRNKSR
jgi:N-acetylmuramoyl-L-alanine amidase